jgi:hypothetical protein
LNCGRIVTLSARKRVCGARQLRDRADSPSTACTSDIYFITAEFVEEAADLLTKAVQ